MPILLAAPAAVVSAIFAIVFLIAWQAWGNTIKQSLNVEIPIGPWSINLFGWIGTALDDAYGLVLWAFDGLLHPIVNFILAPIATVENAIDTLREAVSANLAAMNTVFSHVLPQWLQNAVDAGGQINAGVLNDVLLIVNHRIDTLNIDFSQLVSLQASLQGSIPKQINDAINAALAGVAASTLSPTQIADLVNQATQAATGAAVSAVAPAIESAYAQSTQYAASLFNTAEADIAGALSTAEAFTTAAVAGIEGVITTDIDNAIAGVLDGIYTDIDGAVTDVTDLAGDWGADILQGVKDIPIGRIADIAGVASLAGATALTLTRYLRDCGIPNCKNLSGYGNGLQDLLGLLGDAAFLAFLVELIHDPADATSLVTGLFGDIPATALAAGRSLLEI